MGRKRKKLCHYLFKEMMIENFPNLEKQTTLRSMKPKEPQRNYIYRDLH